MMITFNNNDRRNRPDRPAKANEWGKRYQFWSCADVDIMPPNNFAQVLSSGSSTGSFIFQIIDINLGPKINYFAPGFHRLCPPDVQWSWPSLQRKMSLRQKLLRRRLSTPGEEVINLFLERSPR